MTNFNKGYMIWFAGLITAFIVQSNPILLWIDGIIIGSMFYYADRE